MLKLLSLGKISPVLVDIGAAGGAPRIWRPIASQSVYVGFDPDLRDMADVVGGEFRRSFVLNKAVTADPSRSEIQFHLTAYPHCSSALAPDLVSLSNYSFHDYFITERKTDVPAITLDAALAQLQLDRIDWMKLDTQGTDLRLFQSLNESARTRMLALDIEPSMIETYQGEDLFVDVHRYMTHNGFWLSNLNVGGASRIRKATLNAIVPQRSLQQIFVHRKLAKSPAWCEARYLRTLESLGRSQDSRREYALLWTFSMLDGQLGFALDVAFEYQNRFGQDDWAAIMQEVPRSRLKVPRHYTMIAYAKRVLPPGVRDLLRAMTNRRWRSIVH
jgi:FkbM family methyltransferase